MKRCMVITEGASDRSLLQTVLNVAPGDPAIGLMAAGGWSSADSLARSVLARAEADMALVVSADTTDLNLVEERRRFLERSLRAIPSSAEWRVFVIAPEIDVLLFEDRHLLESLVGQQVTDTDFVRGRFEPKRVLNDLLGNQSRAKVYEDRLPQIDLSPLRELPSVKELRDFVTGVTRGVPAYR